nr:MAG TPA: hypothetical protein [Caudoviricetes sp.]
MNIGDKVQFTKVIREHCVLKAKTGQTGILKEINDSKVKVELSNGDIIGTIIGNIKPYEKKEKFSITKASNEELVDKFETLVAYQWQTKNTQTKSFDKVLKDIDSIRIELLKRLNKDI